MTRPLLLDAFCCAGGGAMGYHRAGFEVVGVDIEPQPRYPFRFIQADALEVLADREFLAEFAAAHASPPCQGYSDLAHQSKIEYPKLVEPVRELLQAAGLPYVIENVEGAPLIDPITLCGTQFPELRVIRHRLFESNVPLTAPREHHPAHPLVYTLDKRKGHYGRPYRPGDYVQVTGGGNALIAAKAVAMGGICWMTGAELNEAIPPAYTELIGTQLLAHIEEVAA